jgi:NhaP-type Na+/H+ or K+/H+ antiporter
VTVTEPGVDLLVVATIAATVVVWGLVAARAERWNVSAPMFFVLVGLLVANVPSDVLEVGLGSEAVRTMAELTLAIVLFGDAAVVRVRDLRRDAGLPSRLLLVGLPVTIVAGALAARLVFPDLSWWVCAAIGAAVAPTDAALGAAIIEDRRIPARIRRLLNVESGLNDGIATPFVNLFLVAAVVGTAFQQGSRSGAVLELLAGAAGGAVVGGGAAWLVVRARAGGATHDREAQIAVVAVALLSFTALVEAGGNGFVAAFVAGLAFGSVWRRTSARSSERAAVHRGDPGDPGEGAGPEVLEFTHRVAAVMSWVVWFVFGAVMVPALADATWRDAVFAVVALTVVRMLPVALALLGSGLDRSTVLVVGWFGPRGLASVVFALLAYGELEPSDGVAALTAITATVLASVVAHGASAGPVSRRFARSHPA